MSADEFHDRGNEAFKNKDWPDAIQFYTSALNYEEKPIFFSNRSAAYLKNGDYEAALKDADACIQKNPKFAKGYSRKGTVLVAMKKFDDAILAYKKGLKECPDDEMLQKGLAATKRAKLGFEESTKAATQAARRGQASMRASVSRQAKAEKAQDVSEFVKETRKALQLKMALLQSQMELLDSLASMSDEEKLELLFTLLDKDVDGFISARELADGIRKRNQGVSFADSLDRAMSMVAVFDADGDAKLSQDEFKTLVETMTTELGSNFHEFAEFLILQMIFLEGNDVIEELAGEIVSPMVDMEVAARKELIDVLVDPRLVQLFMLFDKNCDGILSFKEVAIGLYQLTSDMEESIKATVDLLLTLDKEDNRTLDYEQFARLILNICAATETTFEDIVDDLTLALSQEHVTMTEEELAELYISDEYYSAAKDFEAAVKEEVEVQDVLSYGRLFKLFDLLDENHDGAIDAKELASGLKRLHGAIGIESDAELATVLLMIGSDEDEDAKLSKEEFARAMVKYASAVGVDVHELVDVMCVTSLSDSGAEEKGYDKAIRQSMAGGALQADAAQVLYLEVIEAEVDDAVET